MYLACPLVVPEAASDVVRSPPQAKMLIQSKLQKNKLIFHGYLNSFKRGSFQEFHNSSFLAEKLFESEMSAGIDRLESG